MNRPDGRKNNELRAICLEPGIAPNAAGSVLAQFGDTKVICAATYDKRAPRWMAQQGVPGGWVTAEYAMLPYSTLDRKMRDSTRGRTDNRNIEIQRLIGRSLRAVIDLRKLPPSSLWLDCDVLQADGGTRTASVTGAYVAAKIAIRKLIEEGQIREDPFRDSVAGISVGVLENEEILDLNYLEDKGASVDFNVVMTGSGQFVEVQGSGEEAAFSREQLDRMIALAASGIEELTVLQEKTLEAACR